MRMNKQNKKDVFLNAIAGTTPIKKSNRNYQPIKKSKIKQKKQKTKDSKIIPQIPKEESQNQEKKAYKIFKIEKSKINKKLKKGMVNIDKKIDFHGLAAEEAKIKFFETIDSCFIRNKRCILFITGKGMGVHKNTHEEKKLYYGKIRNEFLSWVYQKKISNKILSVEQAGPSHGGDGAFFVYLRKNKN